MQKRLLILIPCILLGLGLPDPVRGATAVSSLGVSPGILESVVKPGKVVTEEVTVLNTTNVPLPIRGTVKNFASSQPIPSAAASEYDASAWFTLTPEDFILQPREQKTVSVSIKAPAKVEPGGHYATIYFEPEIPEEAIAEGSTMSLAQVGVLAFLIAPGDIQEHLNLTSVTLPKEQTLGPVTLALSLENDGNIHTSPTGTITIRDMLGRMAATLPLPDGTILPHTTRPFTITWDKTVLIGRYTVAGTIMYGADHTKLNIPPTTIWILPWHLILLTMLLLTSSIWFVIVGRSRFGMAWRVLTGKADAWELKPIPLSSNKSVRKPKQGDA